MNKSVIRCGCGKEFAPPPLSLRALAGGAGITCREEGGAPSLGRLSSLDPPTILTQFSSCFFLIWVGWWFGVGGGGAPLRRGALTVIPTPVVGNHPTTNSSLQVIPMEKLRDRASMKPWVSPRSDPVVGTQGGLKVERGRLSLAPLGSEGGMSGSVVMPSGEVIKVPDGFEVRLDRWGNALYRVSGKDSVVELVAELLYRVSRSYRGSVAYLDNRRMAALLGLRNRGNGRLDVYSSSWVRGILTSLGFEEVEVSRGKAIVIDMNKPIMSEVRNAKSVDEVVEIVKRYLR